MRPAVPGRHSQAQGFGTDGLIDRPFQQPRQHQGRAPLQAQGLTQSHGLRIDRLPAQHFHFPFQFGDALAQDRLVVIDPRQAH